MEDEDDELNRALALSMQQPSADLPPVNAYADADAGGPSLATLIFGEFPLQEVLKQWGAQGVSLISTAEADQSGAPGVVPFGAGLAQEHGGPCAILAAAQAFMLRRLFFDPTPAAPQPLPPAWLEAAAAGEGALLPADSDAIEALHRGLADILCGCATAPAAAPAGGAPAAAPPAPPTVAALEACQVVLAIPTAAQLESLMPSIASLGSAPSPIDAARELLYQLVSIAARPCGWSATLNELRGRLDGLRSPIGALCLLVSAVLTRTSDKLSNERGEESVALIDQQFGHASQEVLNLLLLGCGVSNVFDGEKDLGGGFVLRGVPCRPAVGLLSQLEALRYLQVGNYYKQPHAPIWVIASESHYSLLFSLSAAVQSTDALSQLEERLLEAFSEYDQEGNGFISSEHLATLITSLPQWKAPPLEDLRLQLDPERSSLILWDVFQRVMLPLHPTYQAKAAELTNAAGGGAAAGGDATAAGGGSYRLYHYNGLAARGHAHKRALRLLEVVPGGAKGQPGAQGQGLSACIATRWKDAMITFEGPEPSIN